MYELLKRVALRLLKVPPEPDPPAGDPARLRVFRAADAYYRYRLFLWFVGRLFATAALGLVAVGVLVGGLAAMNEGEPLVGLVVVAAGVGFGVLLLVATLLSYAALRLDYEMRWYMVTDRSLRIREGVYGVREMTLTFANIQNISVSQGPLQRVFGISDLLVRTAGGGGGAPGAQQGAAGHFGMHVGYFRGVDNAEEIRELMLARLRAVRDSGLGTAEAEARGRNARGGWSPDDASALRTLAAEASALRAAAERLR